METNAAEVKAHPAPDKIMQLGMGFWGSKALLSAVELGLFTHLSASGPMDAQALEQALKLSPKCSHDFLDALVALGMLERHQSRYSNTPDTAMFLDKAKPSYLGGLLEMANARLYPFWGSLTEALQTGLRQNETKQDPEFFDSLYADPQQVRQFLSAMTGLSLAAGRVIAQKFPWGDYKTFVDVGCAQGGLSTQVALAHPHLSGGGFDLPPVRALFEEYVAGFGLSSRLKFHPGSFLTDSLPHADVLVMGRVLHDWDLDTRRMLLRKAYEALPQGGSLIVYEALIDDDRRVNAFGLLMSLNMVIETEGGADYTGADCQGWMRETGFRSTRVERLIGADSMVVAVK